MKVTDCMKARLVLLGIVALALLLAACAPPPALRDDTLVDDTSLVTGDPCTAPCWRGITPGETLWRDALTIIEDDTQFENIQTREDEASDAIGAIWNVAGGPECCQMVAEDGTTVNLIFVRPRPNMTVGQLIEAHGEPVYAIGTPVSEDQAIINLVYPDLPIIVLAFVPGEQGNLSETSEIIGVFYTTEADMELFVTTQSLHAWEGYAPYTTYRTAEDADYEVTPSVTLTPTVAAE
jgi:hypothetical protein